jgi:hypothetical protein
LKKKRENITSLCSTSSIETAVASRRWQIVKRQFTKAELLKNQQLLEQLLPEAKRQKEVCLLVVTTSGLNLGLENASTAI